MSVSKMKDKNGKPVKDKNGIQKYKVKINYKRPDGSTRWLTRICAGKSNADRLEMQLINQYKDNSKQDMTFKALVDYYFMLKKNDLRLSTYRKKQEHYINNIAPYFDNILLSDIDIKKANNWKITMDNKNISVTTKNSILATFNSFLNFAVENEYIEKNPLKKIGKFKDANALEKSVNFYTPEEFKKFISVAYAQAQKTGCYDYYVFFSILYLTGVRKGECHALRWRNVDFTTNRMYIKTSISQKLGRFAGGYVETRPKNKSSVRDFTIPKILADILKDQMYRQQQTITDWNTDGFICGYFHPLSDSQIDNLNRKYAAEADIKKIRIHDFRHSFVSFLINNNIPVTEIAHRVGHSSTEQTLKTYSHLFHNLDEVSANLLNSIDI